MKTMYQRLFMLSICCGWCSVILGSTRVEVSVHGGAFQEPGIQVTPNVIQVGNPLDCPTPGCSQTLDSPSSLPLDAVAGGGGSFQSAITTANAAAHAEIGKLGINIQAGGSAGQDKAKAEATASAVAEWRYIAPFISNRLPDGAMVTVHSVLFLEGDLNGVISGENASIFGSFRIEDLSGFPGLPAAPYDGGTWGLIHAVNGVPEVNEVPAAIRLTRQMRNNALNPIGFRFSLFGLAQSDTTTNLTIEAKAGNALVTADASHSLRWGGIESVIDEFGNPVTDWTFIGANGFDFSKPFPVPEPTGGVTAFGALLLLCCRRIGRRSADND